LSPPTPLLDPYLDNTHTVIWFRYQINRTISHSTVKNNSHVWMEVLVLVCNKLTPKLTLWSQTHVLVWC
jgi:hypothetical protein